MTESHASSACEGWLAKSPAGTGRHRAIPNFAHFAREMDIHRHWRYSYVYSEYVSACERAGENPYAYGTFCTEFRKWRRQAEARAVPEWYPGEYVRTYWSRLTASVGGKTGSFPVFLAVMAYSGVAFACRVEKANTDNWMRCCEMAFRWMGGVPYVTDCSQSKVSKSAQITLEAFARHYRTVLYGSRPKAAKKASVGGKPLDAKNSPLLIRRLAGFVEGIDFPDLGTLDEAIAQGVEAVNSTAQPSGRSPLDVFSEYEKPQLLGLPAEGADFAKWGTRSVQDDYHFVVGGVKYSVPWQYASETVLVSWTDNEVRAYSGGELIAIHERMVSPQGRCVVTDPSHRPPSHSWFANRMDRRFLAMASELGPSVARGMRRVLEQCKAAGGGFRPCKELLDLQKLPSPLTLDEACRSALKDGEFSIDSVRQLMEDGET